MTLEQVAAHYPVDDVEGSITTKAGFRRNGDLIFVREDGSFKFFDADFTGLALSGIMLHDYMLGLRNSGNMYFDNTNAAILTAGILSWQGVVDFVQFPILIGLFPLTITNAISNGNVSTPCVSVSGQILTVEGKDTAVGADISLQWNVQGTGASITGTTGSDLSSLIMKQRSFLKLYSANGDAWQVLGKSNVTERAS